jgi:hypothetical protein
MTFSLLDTFRVEKHGSCLYCGHEDTVVVVAPPVEYKATGPSFMGVCDLCSYALRHVWKRELGEIVAATSPRTVGTRVLIPRLSEGKSELDVSAYELAVLPASDHGDDRWMLPHIEFQPISRVVEKLAASVGIVTWESTLREVYLGYSGTGDYTNVLIAWAWGQLPGLKRKGVEWKTFAELLSKPTQEAGFYLGVKAAFETLLWRREVSEEGGELGMSCPVSVVLGEGAVRCLGEGEDPKMVELFRASLTPSEAEVVRLVMEARRSESSKTEASGKQGKTKAPDETGEFQGDLEVDDGDAGEPSRDLASIPPGYARAPR